MDDLCEKIRDSEVKVEVDSHNSNLAVMLNNIRHQYDNLAKKNLKDTEDWYQNEVPAQQRWLSLRAVLRSFTIFSFSPQFENIKVAEAQNNEALLSSKKELKELLKQKQTLDIRIQSIQAMVGTHVHTCTHLSTRPLEHSCCCVITLESCDLT